MPDISGPVALAELLIRKPANEVFNAFADEKIITQFWFDKSTGSLTPNARVEWHWTIFGFSVPVVVTDFIENEKIFMSWGEGEHQSELEWTFTPRDENTTHVRLVNKGFQGTDDTILATALDSTGGFNLVLAAAKAWLEHGIKLNVVEDKA